MASKGQLNDMFKQLEEYMKKCDSLSQKITEIDREHKKEIKKLNAQIKHLEKDNVEKDKQIIKLTDENEKLKAKILKLKNKNNKDSSNSSKPSSTNGYKKVITNRREPSQLKKGGQPKHEGNNLDMEKLQKILNSDKTIVIKKEINKNSNNENKKPIIRRVIDIQVTKVVTEYWYYPNEDGKYDIAEEHNRPIQYGNYIKAFALSLMYDAYNSMDSVSNIISNITDGDINISKGTLINWTNKLSENLDKEIDNIEKSLLDSYYLNCDESQIKIDGDNYNNICVCNNKHTRLWISKQKKQDAIKKIGFLEKFSGVIVKDGTDLYNGFGTVLAQCVSHIQRYIKEIIDGINHKGAKLMKSFFKKCCQRREELINQSISEFEENEYNSLIKEYEEILYVWKKEWMKSKASENSVYDEERKLLHRFEDSDKEQILYFLKDFKIPTTNNQAEVDQRNIKIKQKIGKFRSLDGAEVYAIIRSCINTYKKNKINILQAFVSAFDNAPIIV